MFAIFNLFFHSVDRRLIEEQRFARYVAKHCGCEGELDGFLILEEHHITLLEIEMQNCNLKYKDINEPLREVREGREAIKRFVK